jgi:beta-fructofuranosidase
LIDRSIFEVFVDDAAFSSTMDFYSKDPLTRLTVRTSGAPENVRLDVAVWELRGIWGT